MDAPLFYQLLLGEMDFRNEEPGAAFSLVLDAARKTNDPAVFRRAVQMALQARAGDSALQAAKAWSQAIPNATEANRFVLQILLGLNRVGDTLEPLKRDLLLTPRSELRELIWALPVIYERVADRQQAANLAQEALSGLLQDANVGATAWATVGRMWLRAGDKAAALSAAQNGQGVDPLSEHAAVLALSLVGPETPLAEKLVNQFLPNARPEFQMAYIKTLFNAQRGDDANAQLQALKASAPNYPDAWLIEGSLALQANAPEQAEAHLQRYLSLVAAIPVDKRTPETIRGRSQAYLAMSQIALSRKDVAAADTWLNKVDNPEDLLRAQLRRASLIAERGQVEEALTLIQSLPERSEEDVRLKNATQVQLLRGSKQFERARDLLKVAVGQNPSNLDQLYDLAMVHEKLNDLAEMEVILRHVISNQPDQPHAYNALGFSLADRNLRLAEAKQLIVKALELAPNDPFITDSLAWVEFRLGNKEEALRILSRIYKEKPDVEIGAHLGEVLWSMERRAEAIDIFKEAQKLNPSNDTLTETIRRLRVPL